MCYTKQEVEIIANNCSDLLQLDDVCICFKYLIDNNYIQKNIHLRTVTLVRFVELSKQ